MTAKKYAHCCNSGLKCLGHKQLLWILFDLRHSPQEKNSYIVCVLLSKSKFLNTVGGKSYLRKYYYNLAQYTYILSDLHNIHRLVYAFTLIIEGYDNSNRHINKDPELVNMQVYILFSTD